MLAAWLGLVICGQVVHASWIDINLQDDGSAKLDRSASLKLIQLLRDLKDGRDRTYLNTRMGVDTRISVYELLYINVIDPKNDNTEIAISLLEAAVREDGAIFIKLDNLSDWLEIHLVHSRISVRLGCPLRDQTV